VADREGSSRTEVLGVLFEVTSWRGGRRPRPLFGAEASEPDVVACHHRFPGRTQYPWNNGHGARAPGPWKLAADPVPASRRCGGATGIEVTGAPAPSRSRPSARQLAGMWRATCTRTVAGSFGVRWLGEVGDVEILRDSSVARSVGSSYVAILEPVVWCSRPCLGTSGGPARWSVVCLRADGGRSEAGSRASIPGVHAPRARVFRLACQAADRRSR